MNTNAPRRARSWWLAVGLTAAGLSGCWQERGELLETSLARDKPLDFLNLQDLKSLCEAGGASYSKVLGAGRANAYACATGAVITARALGPDASAEGRIPDLASCEQQREQCTAMRAMQPPDWKMLCADPRAPIGLNDYGCPVDATVSVYERCFIATLHLLREDIDTNATCAALDGKPLAEITHVPAPPALPAECELLHQPSLASCIFDVSRF